MVAEFRTPYDFGVRLHKREKNRDDTFKDTPLELLTKDIIGIKNQLVPLTFKKTVLGTKVIYCDEAKKPDECNYWNQKYWRGVIAATITNEQLQDRSSNQKKQMLVLVDLIDHGVTYQKRIEWLYFFDEETCNYGLPDLFSRLPRQGFRVSLSSLQPNFQGSRIWSGVALKEMVKFLHHLKDGYVALIRLDIEFSSKFRHRIIAKDILPLKTKTQHPSFVTWALAPKWIDEHTPDIAYAMPMQNICFDDMIIRHHSPSFCPRPSNTSVSNAYQQRSMQLTANPSQHSSFSFAKVYSPMQVSLVPVLQTGPNLGLRITDASINCCLLDYRLAEATMTAECYDPLSVVASELRFGRYDGTKTLFSGNTTILNQFTDVVPIVQILMYPMVELLMVKGFGPVCVILFNFNHHGQFQEAGRIPIKARLWKQDLTDMNKLRSIINNLHVKGHKQIDSKDFRSTIIRLLQHHRKPLNAPYPEYDSPHTSDHFSGAGIMIPNIIETDLEDVNL